MSFWIRLVPAPKDKYPHSEKMPWFVLKPWYVSHCALLILWRSVGEQYGSRTVAGSSGSRFNLMANLNNTHAPISCLFQPPYNNLCCALMGELWHLFTRFCQAYAVHKPTLPRDFRHPPISTFSRTSTTLSQSSIEGGVSAKMLSIQSAGSSWSARRRCCASCGTTPIGVPVWRSLPACCWVFFDL